MKKVAFISASSSGIGKAIVRKLIKNDYIVYANGREKKKLDELSKKINNKNFKFIIADCSKEKDIINILTAIYKNEGRLDLLVANLGSGKSISGWDIEISEYKRIFEVNFFAAVMLATNAIKYLQKSNGNIIFISSIAGCETLGAPIAYSSAKTALLSYSKSLSEETSKFKIRVNCISPGNVMFKGSTWDDKIKKDKKLVKKYIKENVSLSKFIKPKDIAKTVIFLENNSSITGSNIIVDAGQIKKII